MDEKCGGSCCDCVEHEGSSKAELLPVGMERSERDPRASALSAGARAVGRDRPGGEEFSGLPGKQFIRCYTEKMLCFFCVDEFFAL